MKWRKLPEELRKEGEAFLRARERFCVTAYARFLRHEKQGHTWFLNNPEGGIRALLLHTGQSLFPVFNKSSDIPSPRFLNRFLGKVPIHAIQALKEDAEVLETLMEAQGYYAAERINYDLMNLEASPSQRALEAGPPELIIRSPVREDERALYELHSAYEIEEVLPQGAVHSPASSQHNLSRILSGQRILVAELEGRLVGKINTNAQSQNYFQIGGVYVRPDLRSRGIATRMCAVFLQTLMTTGRSISLFVKKRNTPARMVYEKIGFSILGDYRINYY
ncbi:MAG: GNAT family N-acetyltransferase [Treponema sp.]|nr:GNAT family N-acetyltransferase [Treponema sp.]